MSNMFHFSIFIFPDKQKISMFFFYSQNRHFEG